MKKKSYFLGAAIALFLGGRVVTADADGFPTMPVDATTALGGKWESIDTGSSGSLHAVAYGENQYVAVGDSGTILYSEDLRSWTHADVPEVGHLTSVTYGNGRFVAVGHGALLVSEDGVVWEIGPEPAGNRGGTVILFAGDRFVVLGAGEGSFPLVSDDGINWTVHSQSIYGSFNRVAYGNGLYVAGGPFSGIVTSPNGIEWSEVWLSGSSFGLAFGADRWIQVTHVESRTSVDGKTWEDAGLPPAGRSAVAFGNGAFVAAPHTATTTMSADGVVWRYRHVAAIGPNTSLPWFRNLFFVNGRFVATINSGNLYLAEGDVAERWIAIEGAGDEFFALDAIGRIFRLEEGIWKENSVHVHPGPLGLAVTESGALVVTGGKGKVAVYRDGDWSSPELPVTNPSLSFDRFVSDAAHDGNGRTVVVGADAAIYYSDDLENWTRATISGEVRPRASLLGVVHGAGRFVAAGNDGTLLYSENGGQWTVATERLGNSLAGIAFGKGRFVVAGSSGTILFSENGERWIRRSVDSPFPLAAVGASEDGFLAGGAEGRLYRSANGRDWERVETGSTVAVTAAGGNFAGFADGTMIEVHWPPRIEMPDDPAFYFRLVEEGNDLELVFPQIEGTLPDGLQWQKDGQDLPGENSMVLHLTDIGLEDLGAYRLLATNEQGTSVSRKIQVTMPIDYETWLVERSPFTEEELGDPEVVSPFAAPFGDKIANVVRYGFGLGGPGDRGRWPFAGVEVVDGYGFSERYLTVTFPRLTGADDINFRFEVSGDLSNWWSLENWRVLATRGDGLVEWVTVRDERPIGFDDWRGVWSDPSRFLRVIVVPED